MPTLDISNGIGIGTAKRYFKNDFANSQSYSYRTEGHHIGGRWDGRLAAEMGLQDTVDPKHYDRLIEGRRPDAVYERSDLKKWEKDGKEYVLRDRADKEVARVYGSGGHWFTSTEPGLSHRNYGLAQKAATEKAIGVEVPPQIRKNENGEKVETHRAGFDMVVNWSKSISVAAVSDQRIYEAERRVTSKMLAAGEQYAQARLPRSSHTSGQWAVAVFQHTTARPVDGVSTPHLHSHAFLMNMTRDEDGKLRSMQNFEIMRAQKFMMAVADAEMALELRRMGYETYRGKNNSVEIKGFTPEYLKSESLRSELINEKIREKYGMDRMDRNAKEQIAHQYREDKLAISDAEVKEQFLKRAAAFGNQHEQVFQSALKREFSETSHQRDAQKAITFARLKLSERLDVFTDQDIYKEALWYGQGSVSYQDVKAELTKRTQTQEQLDRGEKAEFLLAPHATAEGEPRLHLTTKLAEHSEQRSLELLRAGEGKSKAIAPRLTLDGIKARFSHYNGGLGLNPEQAQAVHEQSGFKDQITGIVGGAGSGKTSSVIQPIRELAEQAGYQVIGLGPSGRSRKELASAGIEKTFTMQKFLMVSNEWLQERRGIDEAKSRLYFVDESSLASTRMYVKMLEEKLRPQDRLIAIGDYRQHESVEAGRIFEEMIQGGMKTSQVDKVVRQKPQELKDVVVKLEFGNAARALKMLNDQGRVKEIELPKDRMKALAQTYVSLEGSTLATAPDNATRRLMNEEIRRELKEAGRLGPDVLIREEVLVQRKDMVRVDRQVAERYEVGNTIRFNSTSQGKYKSGEYATVIAKSEGRKDQWIEVRFNGRRGQPTLRYDPARHYGVEVYRTELRDFSKNERLTLKRPGLGLENGDTFTIKSLKSNGDLVGVADKDNKEIRFNIAEMRHLDHGYASTSHSSQGATYDNVLTWIDTSDMAGKKGITKQFAYVSISRGRHESIVFVDDLKKAQTILTRDQEKHKALSYEQIVDRNVKRVGPIPAEISF